MDGSVGSFSSGCDLIGSYHSITFPSLFIQNGNTALAIAKRLGYISVVDTLKVVTEEVITTTTVSTADVFPLFYSGFTYLKSFFKKDKLIMSSVIQYLLAYPYGEVLSIFINVIKHSPEWCLNVCLFCRTPNISS